MTSDNGTPQNADIEQMSFEQAQAELEAIVEQLEDQHTGLEQALALWERGEALHRHCQAKLDYAAERIQQLNVSAEEAAAVAREGADEDFAAPDVERAAPSDQSAEAVADAPAAPSHDEDVPSIF